VKRGSAYVPTPQYTLLDIADALPGAGDLVGPAGFLERLGWYRDMLATRSRPASRRGNRSGTSMGS
jgi:hypothetical protein